MASPLQNNENDVTKIMAILNYGMENRANPNLKEDLMQKLSQTEFQDMATLLRYVETLKGSVDVFKESSANLLQGIAAIFNQIVSPSRSASEEVSDVDEIDDKLDETHLN